MVGADQRGAARAVALFACATAAVALPASRDHIETVRSFREGPLS